jgi:hypothetical protein
MVVWCKERLLRMCVNLFFCLTSRQKSAQAQGVVTPQQPPTHRRETMLADWAAEVLAAVLRFLDFQAEQAGMAAMALSE